MLFAMFSDTVGLLPTRQVVALLFVTIFLGLYVFILFLEKVFAKYFIDFKSTQLFWAGLVAFFAYIAHGQAGDEINSIFGQDASTFPYATVAATAMIMASWSLKPALYIGALSFLFGLYRVFKSKGKFVLMALTVGIQLFSFSLFVKYQMEGDAVRKNNIYQVALAMDFNGKFRCDDAKIGGDSVAFIGASQNSALVAPPVVVKHENKKSIFKEVEVPIEFRRVSCS
jgi:hypothetical protein